MDKVVDVAGGVIDMEEVGPWWEVVSDGDTTRFLPLTGKLTFSGLPAKVIVIEAETGGGRRLWQ
jgi:hypothetical protein